MLSEELFEENATEVLYMDLDTGEVLTYDEMMTVFREEYDGDDPTNCVPWTEYFERIENRPYPHFRQEGERSILYEIYGDELEGLL